MKEIPELGVENYDKYEKNGGRQEFLVTKSRLSL